LAGISDTLLPLFSESGSGVGRLFPGWLLAPFQTRVLGLTIREKEESLYHVSPKMFNAN
jgi:hypothetical protein